MRHTTPIANKFWAKVVKAEGCWTWTASKIGGYGRLQVANTTIYAHRISYEIHNGPIPAGMMVDHICRNKQNHEHLEPRTNFKSGHRGVWWRPDIQKWKGTVRSNGKCYHVGYFEDLEEAACAVRAKRNELFTHNDLDR